MNASVKCFQLNLSLTMNGVCEGIADLSMGSEGENGEDCREALLEKHLRVFFKLFLKIFALFCI